MQGRTTQGPERPKRPEAHDGGAARTSRSQVAGIALVALVLALVPALPAESWGPVRSSRPALGSAGAEGAPVKPNIIVIQTDDQEPASVNPQVMPNVVRYLANPGTTFTKYIDSGPLCCPSRAAMLTGQYGHNNGVMWNVPGYGALREKGNTLPVWLQQAGYVTAHVGKYLNLYGRATGDPNLVAPGWDEWDTVLEPGSPQPAASSPYYDYTLRVNGHAVKYGSAPSDYLTHVLNDKAVELIRRYVPGPRPLFMAVDQAAPHTGPNTDARCRGSALPAPSDSNAFVNAPLRTPPSFNEADVRDKPRFIRVLPRMTRDAIAGVQREQNCRLASLLAVDRGVGRIIKALAAAHELSNTAIFYTSDNGYLLGEHRAVGKIAPYEADLRVPFVARVPKRLVGGGQPPAELNDPVANVDVAPTILGLAGARPCDGAGVCRVLDGRSLLPAIQSDGADWPHDRAIPLELKTPLVREKPPMPCAFNGVKAANQILVIYHSISLGSGCVPDHEVEHYDLGSDPSELENLYPASPGTAEARRQRSLRLEAAALSDCSGIQGRDPRPASGHYCQ